ncbi:sugar transferase [Spongisporangium articulatum]|uniref:Sugar transferase n=1 Tax=Spongisporangium articulatum TaxID=3362603 RepID=A0ABW8AT90_9ACTN
MTQTTDASSTAPLPVQRSLSVSTVPAPPGHGAPPSRDTRPPSRRDLSPGRPDDSAARLLTRYRTALLGGDALIVAVAVSAAVWLRFDDYAAQSGYRIAPLLAPLLWLGLLAANRTYETRFLASGSQETERVVRAGLASFMLVAVTSYSFAGNISRSIVLFAIPCTMAGSLLLRWVLRRGVHRARAAGRGVHRTVVVGRHDAAHHLIAMLRSASFRGLSPVAACVPPTEGLTAGAVDGVPVLGSPGEVLDVVERTGAHTVAIVSHPDLAGHQLRRLSWALEERGVDLLVSPGIMEVAGPRLSIRPVAGLSLLHLEKPAAHGGKMLLKATLDRVFGTALLVFLAPVLVGLALAVRLSSSGPAFFRQTRVGADGREFTIVKFRTMVVDAEAHLARLAHLSDGNGILFKMRADPRVTRVGAFLRRYSLDELPQLINVARGEMSLVGPRPPLPSEVATYDGDATRRLRVRPGMTGLWQVSGRSDLSWEEALRLDLRYVDNWSIGMDLVILWRTVRAVFVGSGAY